MYFWLTLIDLWTTIKAFFANDLVQCALFVILATLHGYAGAWLAIRMLFRPRRPFKLLGITIFPQGMIPRHRDRLANAIGKAVGDELVSQETIMEELMGKEFLRKKIQSVVDSYSTELISQDYPSLIDTLPQRLREPVLDAIFALQLKIAEHIEGVLKSEESLDAIYGFVERRVDEFLSQRVSDVLDDETFEKTILFLDERLSSSVRSPAFEEKIKDFVSRRVDDLANTDTPLGDLFTGDAVALLKEKANEQLDPIIHQLTELAAAERTRTQISALIKKEVHDYYEQLPFFKKIFVSRDNLLKEVDDLVNDSLPKRIEETLRGEFFADEARNFVGSAIDKALARPLPAVVGTIASDQLERLKAQIAQALLSVLQGDAMRNSVVGYVRETLETFRPHSIDAIMETLLPASEEKLKKMLAKGLLGIISQKETSQIINAVLADQIDRLLSAPIGKLSDHIPEDKLREASGSLTDAIISAIQSKLPEAIREFDVGGVVREKIRNYPAEKLESLVLSVAKEHLRTIELFGALFGFVIGLGQAIWMYLKIR
jgi:uncharacterized membrane protein YheB (UPF0754 family)